MENVKAILDGTEWKNIRLEVGALEICAIHLWVLSQWRLGDISLVALNSLDFFYFLIILFIHFTA